MKQVSVGEPQVTGDPLLAIVRDHKRGQKIGIYSICSANRFALEAAMHQALADGSIVVIESTSNQVDQYGGYTGMTPADFRALVLAVATQVNFPVDRLILGGDHLGPNSWQKETAASAMQKACVLMQAYVEAGFHKIHLDASMRCADDPGDDLTILPMELAVERTAELCQICEERFVKQNSPGPEPCYVIGTEVPIPGGAKEELSVLTPTVIEDATQTIEMTRSAFFARGLESAWERVIALVVQPGVEFGDFTIIYYDPVKAKPLKELIAKYEQLVYEAHSTDYQSAESLRRLVRDGFAILKVGPWMTFAFREAIFALAAIEKEWLTAGVEPSHLPQVILEAMFASPRYWRDHYHGDHDEISYACRYSYSDRIRYYWPMPVIQDALRRLLRNLSQKPIPMTLLSQYLPNQHTKVREGRLDNSPQALIRDKIMEVTQRYAYATGAREAMKLYQSGRPSRVRQRPGHCQTIQQV